MVHVDESGSCHIVSLTWLSPGEEITVNYIKNHIWNDRKSREETLRVFPHSFTECLCDTCANHSGCIHTAENDKRVNVMEAIHDLELDDLGFEVLATGIPVIDEFQHDFSTDIGQRVAERAIEFLIETAQETRLITVLPRAYTEAILIYSMCRDSNIRLAKMLSFWARLKEFVQDFRAVDLGNQTLYDEADMRPFLDFQGPIEDFYRLAQAGIDAAGSRMNVPVANRPKNIKGNQSGDWNDATVWGDNTLFVKKKKKTPATKRGRQPPPQEPNNDDEDEGEDDRAASPSHEDDAQGVPAPKARGRQAAPKKAPAQKKGKAQRKPKATKKKAQSTKVGRTVLPDHEGEESDPEEDANVDEAEEKEEEEVILASPTNRRGLTSRSSLKRTRGAQTQDDPTEKAQPVAKKAKGKQVASTVTTKKTGLKPATVTGKAPKSRGQRV